MFCRSLRLNGHGELRDKEDMEEKGGAKFETLREKENPGKRHQSEPVYPLLNFTVGYEGKLHGLPKCPRKYPLASNGNNFQGGKRKTKKKKKKKHQNRLV